jgi:hypothetical protein
MTIHDINSGAIRSGGSHDPKRVDGGGDADEVSSVSRVERVDRVEISEEGRALAAAAEVGESMSPEHASQINARIADGTYDTAEVAEEVARRILDSGDV